MLEDFPMLMLAAVLDPMIGQVIENHILQFKLGAGGMGAVYLAVHEHSPTNRCVIKTILPQLARHPIAVERFWTEMKAVSLLNHENIVRLLNFGKLSDGQLYIKFELVEGKSLDKHLVALGGRIPLRIALYLVFQVCDALEHVHAAGVVHRDLKPENLLLKIDLKKRTPVIVMLVDFGISKVPRAGQVQTASGMVLGTPTHMAVEQHDSPGDVTGAADVYALAIILWELLTGELPWGRPESPTVLYHLQRTKVPEAPPIDLMPAAVTAILRRCLSPEPSVRPPPADLAIALADAVDADADNGQPSGLEILEDLVPRLVDSAPATAVTSRNAVGNHSRKIYRWMIRELATRGMAPMLETAPARSEAHLPPLAVITLPPEAPPPKPAVASSPAPQVPPSAPAPEAPPSVSAPESVPVLLEPSLLITAKARPRALAVLAAAAAPAPLVERPASPALISPAAQPDNAPANQRPRSAPAHAVTLQERPPAPASSAPLLASLPTGLLSQRFTAPLPADVAQQLIDARVPPVVAASEFTLAKGTPGPEPYAHAEMPAVLVSTTQLSGLTPQASTPSAEPLRPREPAPFLVLPGVSQSTPQGTTPRARSARGKLLVLGAIACVIVAAASFALVRVGSHDTPAIADATSRGDTVRPRAASPSSPPLAVVVATEHDADIVGRPPLHVAATSPGDAGIAADASAFAPGPVTSSSVSKEAPSRSVSPSDVDAKTPAPTASGSAASSFSAPSVTPVRSVSPSEMDGKTPPTPSVKRGQGELVIEVDTWATIWINGKKDEAPFRQKLPAGRYYLRMQHEEEVDERTVVIRQGEITTVKKDW